MGDSELLERLGAESDIRAVIARYARGIDRCDLELVRSCYHPDGIDEHGAYSGPVDGFIETLSGLAERYESIMHHQAPSLIELDGDVAWVETYCVSMARLARAPGEPARDRRATVRYCDRFERRDGVWLIAHRIVVWGPARIDVAVEEPVLTDGHYRDARDRTDQAYRRLWEQTG